MQLTFLSSSERVIVSHVFFSWWFQCTCNIPLFVTPPLHTTNNICCSSKYHCYSPERTNLLTSCVVGYCNPYMYHISNLFFHFLFPLAIINFLNHCNHLCRHRQMSSQSNLIKLKKPKQKIDTFLTMSNSEFHLSLKITTMTAIETESPECPPTIQKEKKIVN